MYEHRKQPLVPASVFYQRVLKNILIALGVMIVSLSIGVTGYYYTEHMSFLDAVHQASMILSGMGPIITDFKTPGGKIFSSVYALFSGVVFITNIGIILAPSLHRIFHKLHVEDN